jgi:hypothetical protein
MNRALHLLLYLIVQFGTLFIFVYVEITHKEALASKGIGGGLWFAGGALLGYGLSTLLFGKLIAAKCNKCNKSSAYIRNFYHGC